METAILLTENSIYANKTGFFINTEFGRVAVETNLRDYDIPEGVSFNTWESAPNTKWAMKHRHSVCDFHVVIEKAKTKFGTHCRIIQAFSRCLFFHIFKEDVTDGVIDAATKIYLEEIDCRPTTINALENEYANNLSVIVRNDFGVRGLIREIIIRRDNDAAALLEVGEKLSHTARNGWTPTWIRHFENGYYHDLLKIILFVAELKGMMMDEAMNITGISTIDVTDRPIYLNGECTLELIGSLK